MATDREKDLMILIIDKIDRVNEKMIKLDMAIATLQRTLDKAIEEEDGDGKTDVNTEMLKTLLGGKDVQEKLINLFMESQK